MLEKGLCFPRYEKQPERELGFDEISRWEVDNSSAKRAGRAGIGVNAESPVKTLSGQRSWGRAQTDNLLCFLRLRWGRGFIAIALIASHCKALPLRMRVGVSNTCAAL